MRPRSTVRFGAASVFDPRFPRERIPGAGGYLSRHGPWNCYTTSVTLPIPMVDDAALRWPTVRTLPLMSWGSWSATLTVIDGSRAPRIEAARSIQQQCIQTIDFQGEIRRGRASRVLLTTTSVTGVE